MFCKYCGKELPDNAIFCINCGKRLIANVQKETRDENVSTVEIDADISKSIENQERMTSNPTENIKSSNSVNSDFSIKKENNEKAKVFVILSFVLFVVGCLIDRYAFSDSLDFGVFAVLAMIFFHIPALILYFISMKKLKINIGINLIFSLLLLTGMIILCHGAVEGCYYSEDGAETLFTIGFICSEVPILIMIIIAIKKIVTKLEYRKIFFAMLAVIMLIGGYFDYKKIAVKSYEKRMYPVFESIEWRWYNARGNYNENPTITNAEATDSAALDMLESYLDYYRGMVAVQRKGDYSSMNEFMDNRIAKVEGDHKFICEYHFYMSRDFNMRMSRIKDEWHSIKQLY